MIKRAKTIVEQIDILKERGVVIDDMAFAEQMLLGIGYYRLGFYSFPFEKRFPKLKKRDHIVKEGTKFEEIVKLYEFDSELRHILLRYLHIIEVDIRTKIMHICSTKYIDDPCWFANTKYVSNKYSSKFDSTIYENLKTNNQVIIGHHHRYSCKYAPAWKTLEFMTFGAIEMLFNNIREFDIKKEIASKYNCSFNAFKNYVTIIRTIRNSCSHGNCIYRTRNITSIIKSPATSGKVMEDGDYHNIKGVIYVIEYLIKQISVKEHLKFEKDIQILNDKYISEGGCVVEVLKMCTNIFGK